MSLFVLKCSKCRKIEKLIQIALIEKKANGQKHNAVIPCVDYCITPLKTKEQDSG